jgi:hypothetical protein
MTTIKLWKDNKTDQEWSIDADDLAAKFWDYDRQHELTGSWPLDRCIRAFITDKETEGGLQSVFDEDQYNDIYSSIRNEWPEDRR